MIHISNRKNLALLLFVILLTACSNPNHNNIANEVNLPLAEISGLSNATGVHVYYLHQQRRCNTCVKIEQAIHKALSCYNSDNKPLYHDVLLTTAQGKQLAEEFKVSYSGIVIVSKMGKTNLTNQAFLLAPIYPDSLHKLLVTTFDQHSKFK